MGTINKTAADISHIQNDEKARLIGLLNSNRGSAGVLSQKPEVQLIS
jgi:hypothetical protein